MFAQYSCVFGRDIESSLFLGVNMRHMTRLDLHTITIASVWLPYNIEMKATNFYQKMEHLHSRFMYMIEM